MSTKNGVWHDAKQDPPADGQRVLCVKENKAGHRDYCFGARWADREWDNGWVTGGGCNNVVLWMPLPEIPEKGE